MACAAWGTAPAHAAISITETDTDSFRYATAPGWWVDGSAPKLTAAPAGADPADDGWLRLTENVRSQRGAAIYNTAFSSAEGLQITFDYAAYGKWTSEDADGLSFFLIDGSTPPTLGSNFGYAAKVSTSAVTNGYVGIGLDAWGGCSALPCGVMDRVIVYGETRSSISHPTPMLTEVPLLGTAVGKIAPVDRPGRIVRITISPVSPAAPYPTVTVEIDPGSGFVKVIDAFSLAGNGPVPATFKMGFGASTGSHVDFHEVRIRSAKTLVSTIPALGQSTLGALAVLLTLLTLPALRRQFK